MDTHVLDNLVTLPALKFSLFYAIAIIYHTCRPRRRTQTKDDVLVIFFLSLICIAVECLTIYFAWTDWIRTFQLVEVVSSSPFLWYETSKFIELSCVLLQICFTNCNIKHIHVSIDIPMLILADYAFNYSKVQPMIILILLNSVIQIMVHLFNILEKCCLGYMQEECCCLTETFICCSKTLENIALLVICVYGWYHYEYMGFNIILSFSIFYFTTFCCLFTTSARN